MVYLTRTSGQLKSSLIKWTATVNSASEYVQATRERSPVHRYVADNGESVAKQEIEHTRVAGHRIALSEAVTADERTLVKEAIRATTRSNKACFVNALKMWEFDSRFKYAEGFAVMTDLSLDGTEHAWCMLDGKKLVDVTRAFDHYHGAIITDPDVLARYTGSELTAYGIIGNRRDQYEFLRERGYMDDR
jgi:hypothetical protein